MDPPLKRLVVRVFNGPAANRTRVSSVQAKYSTTRLRALVIVDTRVSGTDTK